MSNRNNRTLSATTLGLNLGTRSLAILAGADNGKNDTLRLRFDYPLTMVDVAHVGHQPGVEPAIMKPEPTPLAVVKPGRLNAGSPWLKSESSSSVAWRDLFEVFLQAVGEQGSFDASRRVEAKTVRQGQPRRIAPVRARRAAVGLVSRSACRTNLILSSAAAS